MSRLIPAGAAAAWILLATTTAAFASKACLRGSDPSVAGDPAAITTVRAAVDAACPCTTFDGSAGKTHADYLRCAAAVIAAQLQTATPAGPLRKQCSSTVKKMYTRSTCGTAVSAQLVPCVRRLFTRPKVDCSIRPIADCVDSSGYSQVPCPGYSNCIDAADINHDLAVAAPGDDGSCVPPECLVCTNIPYSSPYNGLDCTSYETGGANAAFCLDDGARVACCPCGGGILSCP